MLGYEVGARAPPDGGKGASAMMFAGRPPNDATKSRPPFSAFLFVRFWLFGGGSTLLISLISFDLLRLRGTVSAW